MPNSPFSSLSSVQSSLSSILVIPPTKMQLTITSLLTLAMAVAAIPAKDSSPPMGDTDINTNPANVCGSQVFSCCNQVNIYSDAEKRAAPVGFLSLIGLDAVIGDVKDLIASGDSNYACYDDDPSLYCQGISACCPGGGNDVTTLLSPKAVKHTNSVNLYSARQPETLT